MFLFRWEEGACSSSKMTGGFNNACPHTQLSHNLQYSSCTELQGSWGEFEWGGDAHYCTALAPQGERRDFFTLGENALTRKGGDAIRDFTADKAGATGSAAAARK